MNRIQTKFSKGQASVGTWMQIPSTSIALILASNGFDSVTLDLEHGSFSLHQIPEIIRAIESKNSIPMIRVAQNHPKDIKQALDTGAKGIIVPMIETFQQAKDFIRWSSYPPLGERGIGYSNANLFGKDFTEYFQSINQELIRIIQVESIRALKEFEQICSIKEIDAVMIGPYDLSGSMNLTGQFDHPKFIETINQFQKIADQLGKPLGTHIIQPNPDKIRDEIHSGKKFIIYSTDAMMLLSQSNINPTQFE